MTEGVGSTMESWRPIDPDKRGRHRTMSSAWDAAVASMLTERNAFFDSLADRWRVLFPDVAARPGRYEDGKIFLYVSSASANFTVRPRLKSIARRLESLPGAPKRVDLRLEIHAR